MIFPVSLDVSCPTSYTVNACFIKKLNWNVTRESIGKILTWGMRWSSSWQRRERETKDIWKAYQKHLLRHKQQHLSQAFLVILKIVGKDYLYLCDHFLSSTCETWPFTEDSQWLQVSRVKFNLDFITISCDWCRNRTRDRFLSLNFRGRRDTKSVPQVKRIFFSRKKTDRKLKCADRRERFCVKSDPSSTWEWRQEVVPQQEHDVHDSDALG